MPRGSICTGLATYAPEPSPLFFQGEWVADMATGCKQGDNFGSLFYAVRFQHHLIKIHDAIQRHIEGFPEGCSPVGGGGVTGFIDDTTIYVDARIANRRCSTSTPTPASSLTYLSVTFSFPQGRSFQPMAS